MTQTIAVPFWLLALIVLFATVTFASHFLFPSVRWFFRRRAERVIKRLNAKLPRPIEPFKLARRYDMIQRLMYDPEVTQAIVDYARKHKVPENVGFEKARRYAREIVPGFSATAYFTIGTRLSKWIARSMYRIRLGEFDRAQFQALNKDATLVFVINHRSNMDYVLVTYLVSRASALSYAVGEWARVWPLSPMIRSMGAYFISRKSRGALYRKVLARYVQMATEGGVTQALFPEGGLSLDGELARPKLGLLNYIISDFDAAEREVVFVPVALNYDHVLEDRILIDAKKAGGRHFHAPFWSTLRSISAYLLTIFTRRFRRFGTATVSFGKPLTLSECVAANSGDVTEIVGKAMMDRIAHSMPVLAVPLVARAILSGHRGPQIKEALASDLVQLASSGATLPRRDAAALTKDALTLLKRRDLVSADGTPANDAEPVLQFYAGSIAHHYKSTPQGSEYSALAK
ncbi:1-acyl-sn-glycerol-3-phosphate acyltransferase [Aestuariibius sp. HNIBRBA575]|uniref:1-acyl-sn-glycerol-3-phosphate acyltransferase n=1 Tax=Aestuariibius sp. HNIBRBA575 TaxID=3233343 RepID=UPI0034A22AF0